MSMSISIEKRSIRGHRSQVTCLHSSYNSPLVASGSEDRTVRLWDRSTSRSVKCLHQCFTTSIEQVRFSKKDDHLIYVASADRIYCFDMRKDAVLDSAPLSVCCHEFTDITTMELSPAADSIVLSDDTDLVCRIDINSGGSFVDDSMRKFRAVHTNSIGSMAFADKRNELYSGGFDFSIVKWDLDNARPINKLELTCFETIDSSNQMYNPPCVTQMPTIEDVPVLIAALGDGSVSAYLMVYFLLCLDPIVDVVGALLVYGRAIHPLRLSGSLCHDCFFAVHG